MSKFLPKRVKSYFTKKHDDLKTQTLVENIRDVEFQIASSEQEGNRYGGGTHQVIQTKIQYQG
jgi:excinuclease UvrABC nuclease subunit